MDGSVLACFSSRNDCSSTSKIKGLVGKAFAEDSVKLHLSDTVQFPIEEFLVSPPEELFSLQQPLNLRTDYLHYLSTGSSRAGQLSLESAGKYSRLGCPQRRQGVGRSNSFVVGSTDLRYSLPYFSLCRSTCDKAAAVKVGERYWNWKARQFMSDYAVTLVPRVCG